ncbi:Protein of unknown function [Pyronema omphalodes CBS 100304]|uniref:Uncharacterized protein n=1 Tax=Pyronema omphalodes (strain CBS 100304) TaxID=1076935 RepID=U4LKJ5_PYROM|nr:Protein of unknown function [Pyronema omphalodes CBS 100304]
MQPRPFGILHFFPQSEKILFVFCCLFNIPGPRSTVYNWPTFNPEFLSFPVFSSTNQPFDVPIHCQCNKLLHLSSTMPSNWSFV